MKLLLTFLAFGRWLSHKRNPNQATYADDGRQHPNHSEPLRIGVAPRSDFVSVRHLVVF